jgi:hypothetical protein
MYTRTDSLYDMHVYCVTESMSNLPNHNNIRHTFTLRLTSMFGMQLHYVTECTTTAVKHNKSLIFQKTGEISCANLQAGHALIHELFGCLLQPLCACQSDDDATTAVDPDANNHDFSFRGDGDAFWWRAHVAWFIMRPRVTLASAVRKVVCCSRCFGFWALPDRDWARVYL